MALRIDSSLKPCEMSPASLAFLLTLRPTSGDPLLVVHSVAFHLVIDMMMIMFMIKINTRSGWRTRVVATPQGRERPAR